MVDSRSYEIQVIAALKAIAGALSSSGASGSSSSGAASSASASGIITALNSITTRLDSIATKLALITTKFEDAMFITEEPAGGTTTTQVGEGEEEEPTKIGLATLFIEQKEVLEEMRDSMLDKTGVTPVSVLTELTGIKKTLDGTTVSGIANKVQNIANNVQTGDANIVTAIENSSTLPERV